jgi:hypothetical protein
MGDWRYSVNILALGTEWWVVSFKPWPLYSHENCPRYPLYEGLDGAQSQPGRYGEKKTLVSTRNRTPAVQPLAYRYTDWPIPALCRRYANTKNWQNYSGTFYVHYERAGWLSGNVLNLYWEGVQFESRLGHLLLWLEIFHEFLRPARKISKQCLDYITAVSFQIHFK